MELFKLFGSIYLKDNASEKIDKTESKAKKMGEGFKKTSKTMAKGAGIIGAAVGVVGAGMTALSNKTAEYADHIDKTSMKMGVSRKALQEWEYVAGQVGVSQEQMNKGLERLNQRMGRAAEGNKKYTDALLDLGFSQKEIQEGTVSTDEAMMRSIETLNGMESSAQKSALASELFGTKMARDLMPAIEAGTLSISELRKEANATGQVMSDDAIKASVKYADTVDKLKKSFGGLTRQIGGQVMPIIQKMLDWIVEHMPQIQATFKVVFDAISTVVGGFIRVIQGVIQWLQNMFSGNEEVLNGMGAKFKEIMPVLQQFAEDAFNKIKEVMQVVWKFVKENIIPIYMDLFEWIQGHMPTIKKTFTQVFTKIKEVLQMVWRVFKNEILPILATLYSKIQEYMPAIKSTVENVFSLVAKVIKTAWTIIEEGLIPIISWLWKKVVKPLLPLIGAAIEDAFNIAIAVINGTIDVIKDVIGWFKDAWDWLTSWNDAKVKDKKAKITYEEGYTSSDGQPIRRYATGTNFAPGGMALVGERGPELVNLPRGSQVKTAEQTESMMGNSYNFERMFDGANINVRSDNDIKKIAKEIYNMTQSKKRGLGVT